MKLKEILDSDKVEFALIDTSIENSHYFTRDIYESKDYRSLNTKQLEGETEVISNLKNILEHSKSYTISAVTQELRAFEQIINKKIEYLSHAPLPKKKKTRIEIKKRNAGSQTQLRLLQDEIYRTRRISYAKELRIEDKNYNLLLDMIKLIEQQTRMGDIAEFSDTDKRLAAALYWLSLFSERAPSLITKDKWFKESFEIAELMGPDSFLPHNDFFRKRIIENPFSLYIGKDGDFELLIKRNLIIYSPNFLITKIPERKNEEIKSDIMSMWKEFNPSIEATSSSSYSAHKLLQYS